MSGVRHDAARELVRAIRAEFRRVGGNPQVEVHSSRPWASITFSGARHLVEATLDGGGADAAADALVANLADREFALRDHLVADIALIADERPEGGPVRLLLEALTVEEG